LALSGFAHKCETWSIPEISIKYFIEVSLNFLLKILLNFLRITIFLRFSLFLVATFSVHAKSIPSLKVIHTFNVYSESRLHFVCVKRTDSGGVLLTKTPPSGKEKDKKTAEFENLLNRLNIFYCDNRGVSRHTITSLLQSQTK
jgi:hypothetical protein